MRLSDRDFCSALQLRLGTPEMLSATTGLTCGCKRRLCETDAEHALACKLLSGAYTLRYDVFARFRRCRALRAGVASSKASALRQPQRQGYAARRLARGAGQRSDALLVLHEGLLMIEVLVMHSPRGRDACAGLGEHGRRRRRDSRHAQGAEYCARGQVGGGYDFEPLIVETYVGLGEPAIGLLTRLAHRCREREGGRGQIDRKHAEGDERGAVLGGTAAFQRRIRRCWRT